MTPDLERAADAVRETREIRDRYTTAEEIVVVALRALLQPSPEVLSAMLTAYWGDEDWRHGVSPPIDEERAKMLAAWRVGLNVVIGERG